MNYKFAIGAEVKKVKGYAFDGFVVDCCDLGEGEIRVLVRQKDIYEKNRRVAGGAIHIFSEQQLELI